MKLLSFLPLFFLLIGCGGVEEPTSDTTSMVDEALEVFVINKEMLEDEVLFGSMCLVTLKKTGNKNGDVCKLYYLTQEQAVAMSKIGLDIFKALANSGTLVEDEEAFYEVIDIVERLAQIEQKAKALRKEIETMTGSGCIKCAI